MPPTANSPSLCVSSEKGFTGEQNSRLIELFSISLKGYPAGKATLIPALWKGRQSTPCDTSHTVRCSSLLLLSPSLGE